MNHFYPATFFHLGMQLFCALFGGLVAYFVIDAFEPMIMVAFKRKRLGFPKAQLLRLGGFLGFALMAFFLVGEIGTGRGGKAQGTGTKEGAGDGTTESGKTSKSAEPVVPVVAPRAVVRDFRVRVIPPDLAARHPATNGDTRKLFLIWDGESRDPVALDYQEALLRVDSWKQSLATGAEPRLTLVYTNDDPDDYSPILRGFSKFLNERGVVLERRTASDAESAIQGVKRP